MRLWIDAPTATRDQVGRDRGAADIHLRLVRERVPHRQSAGEVPIPTGQKLTSPPPTFLLMPERVDQLLRRSQRFRVQSIACLCIEIAKGVG